MISFIDGRFDEMDKQTLSYTPSQDRWRRHANMPIQGGMTHAGQATDGANIFTIGGMATDGPNVRFPDCSSVDSALKYSIAEDTWYSTREAIVGTVPQAVAASVHLTYTDLPRLV